MLGRDQPELGRLKPPPRDELGLERWTVLARPELGRLLAGRLTLAREGIDAGRLTTLLVREGLTRGCLTMAVLTLDRGTELVRVGPPPVRPTALVAADAPGGRWTTVVLAAVVRARLTESTRLVLGLVRVTVRVRALGARLTVPTRRLGAAATVPARRLAARATVWVRVGFARARLTEPVGLTTPRPERPAGGLARTVVRR